MLVSLVIEAIVALINGIVKLFKKEDNENA